MEFGGLSIISMIMEIMYSFGMQQWAYQESDRSREDQQAYQSEREDIAYERNLNEMPNRYQSMLDLGINPNLAADSILGGTGSTPASALSAPQYPSPLSTMGSLNQLFGNIQDSLMNSEKRSAEVANLRADTDKKQIEAGLLPRDYQLRVMSTDAQIRLWSATADKYCKEAKLTEVETNLVKQQNIYYGRLSEAEIQSYKAKVAEAYANANLAMEKLRTEEKSRKVMDSQIAVNDSQVAVNGAQVQNLGANTDLQYQQAYNTEVNTERVKIAKNFEDSLGGIPLTADAQKYIHSLVLKGDVAAIENFYQSIFATSLNQTLGTEYGTATQVSLPFGILSSKVNRNQHFFDSYFDSRRGVKHYFTPDFLR